MSEEQFKELLEYKNKLMDKIPYDIAKNIPSKIMANMTIEQLEKLDPKYKPPKEKKGLTPQEQDLADIKAFENPKFKIDLEDSKFARLEPKIKNIYKDRFEEVSKLLEKELSVEPLKMTAGKMSMKSIPVPEPIPYNPKTVVPIMTREEIDTVDQEKKIKELRKYQEELIDKSLKDDHEKDSLKSRVQALKKEVVKERYGIE